MASASIKNGPVDATVWNCSAIAVRARNSTNRISQRFSITRPTALPSELGA